jgi:hypothetical protein
MLEGGSTGFKVYHLNGVSITRWSKKSEPEHIINRDGEIGSKFLERWINLGFKQSGTVVFRDR